MAWVEIEKQKAGKFKAHDAPVVISVSPPGGRYAQFMIVTVRAAGLLAFWKAGATVQVKLGSGEHAGKLRFEPIGPFTIRSMGRSVGSGVASVRFEVPPGIVTEQINKKPARFTPGADWLEITLPAWTERPRAAEAPGLPPPAARRDYQEAVARPAPAGAGGFRTAATNGTAPRPAAGGR